MTKSWFYSAQTRFIFLWGKHCSKWSFGVWMNISVVSAIECNFCDLNFFGFNVLTVSKSQTLIIHDNTFAVALNQVLRIWLINARETLNRSAMSSFRSPRCIFINVIRNSSYLACKQVPFFVQAWFDKFNFRFSCWFCITSSSLDKWGNKIT